MTDVAGLIDAVLPFDSNVDAIEKLTLACAALLHAPCAVLTWHDSFLQTTEHALWREQGGYSRYSAPASTGDPPVPLVDSELEARICWFPLAGTDAVYGLGACVADPHLLPAGTTIIVARLLETALRWESSLREAKLSALAEYAAGAGHEINNPLGTITGRTAQLLREERDPERRRMLETIGAQAYRIRDMIGDSMSFARPPVPVREKLHLASVVRDVLDRFAGEIHGRGLQVTIGGTDDVPVVADPAQLAVVISELVRNSLAAVSERGRIELTCESVHDNVAGRAWGRLRVIDDGTGLTDLEREHCFDPFFSGRQAGRGLGFGLSKCWRIVRQHQGRLELVRTAPGETEFQVWFPSEFPSQPRNGGENPV